MRHPFACVAASAVLAFAHVAAAPAASADEPIIGLPCEGCELVFVGMPHDLDWHARIAPVDEPGEPLRLAGTVRDAAGHPVPGVIVYAYHTDAHGIYPHAATRHGRLRGWARTNAEGRYRFDTIRPGSYPDRRTPEHIHMHVIEPGCCTYYIDSVHFTDDPRFHGESGPARGGSGVVTPHEDAQGHWLASRDIILGENVPGYAAAHHENASQIRRGPGTGEALFREREEHDVVGGQSGALVWHHLAHCVVPLFTHK